jgi:hypothetical protein
MSIYLITSHLTLCMTLTSRFQREPANVLLFACWSASEPCSQCLTEGVVEAPAKPLIEMASPARTKRRVGKVYGCIDWATWDKG